VSRQAQSDWKSASKCKEYEATMKLAEETEDKVHCVATDIDSET